MNQADRALLRKSRRTPGATPTQPLALAAFRLGQSCPQRCPQPEADMSPTLADPLGPSLSIGEAAALIGCSPWTVRQRYLPSGIPHHRASPNGKLVFYRNQVIRWLLREQQKGGTKHP